MCKLPTVVHVLLPVCFLDVSSKGASALVMVDHQEKLFLCAVVTKIKLIIGINLFLDP